MIEQQEQNPHSEGEKILQTINPDTLFSSPSDQPLNIGEVLSDQPQRDQKIFDALGEKMGLLRQSSVRRIIDTATERVNAQINEQATETATQQIETEIKALQQEIETLDTEISDLDDEINDYKRQKQTAETTIQSANERITLLTQQRKDIHQNIRNKIPQKVSEIQVQSRQSQEKGPFDALRSTTLTEKKGFVVKKEQLKNEPYNNLDAELEDYFGDEQKLTNVYNTLRSELEDRFSWDTEEEKTEAIQKFCNAFDDQKETVQTQLKELLGVKGVPDDTIRDYMIRAVAARMAQTGTQMETPEYRQLMYGLFSIESQEDELAQIDFNIERNTDIIKKGKGEIDETIQPTIDVKTQTKAQKGEEKQELERNKTKLESSQEKTQREEEIKKQLREEIFGDKSGRFSTNSQELRKAIIKELESMNQDQIIDRLAMRYADGIQDEPTKAQYEQIVRKKLKQLAGMSASTDTQIVHKELAQLQNMAEQLRAGATLETIDRVTLFNNLQAYDKAPLQNRADKQVNIKGKELHPALIDWFEGILGDENEITVTVYNPAVAKDYEIEREPARQYDPNKARVEIHIKRNPESGEINLFADDKKVGLSDFTIKNFRAEHPTLNHALFTQPQHPDVYVVRQPPQNQS